jgi:hypothetical protein
MRVLRLRNGSEVFFSFIFNKCTCLVFLYPFGFEHFFKLHLPLPIIDEDLDTMVHPPLQIIHEDFLELEDRMILLQQENPVFSERYDTMAKIMDNLLAEVALLRQQNEQLSQKLWAIHHVSQAPAPPARDPRTIPIPAPPLADPPLADPSAAMSTDPTELPLSAEEPPPPSHPPPPSRPPSVTAPQPPPPPGPPPPSHEPPPAPHPPPSLILPWLPRCARAGCDKPRHSRATELTFPGHCCWCCWNGDPYHGGLCGDRIKKKRGKRRWQWD